MDSRAKVEKKTIVYTTAVEGEGVQFRIEMQYVTAPTSFFLHKPLRTAGRHSLNEQNILFRLPG